ncbi:MAG: phosphatidylglycerophosphatase A [Bdellovibrionia bacterium]
MRKDSVRRKMDWNQVSGPTSWVVFLGATVFGAGLFPKMPGTMGTLAAVPLAYWVNSWSLGFSLGFWVLLSGFGVWCATRFDQLMNTGDNQNIVIDEVVGFGISTLSLQPQPSMAWVVAFFLFRFFDGFKLPPVRQIDQWSKNHSSAWMGGVGVVADDLVAALQTLGVILLLQWGRIL